MGPIRTDVEVFVALRGRLDATKIMTRLAYFAECLANKGREVDRLRQQLGSESIESLATQAGRVSEDISRLEFEREAYIDSVLSPSLPS
jgi:hypothetical protein